MFCLWKTEYLVDTVLELVEKYSLLSLLKLIETISVLREVEKLK